MSEISITSEGLRAFAAEVVKETLKQLKKQTMTKSEYSRVYKISRNTINRMVNDGELKLDKHGKIMIHE